MPNIQNDSLLFVLPKGKSINLISWNKVVNELSPGIAQLKQTIDTQNQYLTEIDTKLKSWVGD